MSYNCKTCGSCANYEGNSGIVDSYEACAPDNLSGDYDNNAASNGLGDEGAGYHKNEKAPEEPKKESEFESLVEEQHEEIKPPKEEVQEEIVIRTPVEQIPIEQMMSEIDDRTDK